MLYNFVKYFRNVLNAFDVIAFEQFFLCVCGGGGERAVAQSVERATPGSQVPGSILAVAAGSLLVGSVSV